MDDVKVMIGISTGEYARRADFYDYVTNLEKPAGSYQMTVHQQSPARARNTIIEQAIEYDCTHILFLDDDMAFKPNMLMELLQHDKDAITGLYLMRTYPHQPLMFDYADDKGRVRNYFLNGNEERLVKIVACGLGACLVKTEVFKKMEQPWVRLGELEKDHWCDDIGLFNRMRAAGVEIFCDMECFVGHMGTMVLWPQRTEDGKWLTCYDTNGKGTIAVPQLNPMVNLHQGIINAIHIEGWMSEGELAWLADVAKTCNTIVEFGSHCGRSTRALGDNCPGITYAVDPWNGKYLDKNDKPTAVLGGGRFPDFQRNCRDLIDSGRIMPVKGKSTDFKYAGKVDFVFIDGDHRYLSVIEDINKALELILPNGIIAGHDFNHPDWPGVKRAVEEVFDSRFNLTESIWWVRLIAE